MNDEDSFRTLIDALRPWLPHLVFVGGWAHRLHRMHDLATPVVFAPLFTSDVDIAIFDGGSVTGSIANALKAAGFEEELSGEFRPPVSLYRIGRENVTAQKVRYLDVLLIQPLTITMKELHSDGTGARIQVANPVSFIAQKLLIKPSRAPGKQAQDTLYIHDTLDTFGPNLEELREMWAAKIRPELSTDVAEAIPRLAHEQFNVLNDVVRNAARMPGDRVLDPEAMRKACAYGLEEIFGD